MGRTLYVCIVTSKVPNTNILFICFLLSRACSRAVSFPHVGSKYILSLQTELSLFKLLGGFAGAGKVFQLTIVCFKFSAFLTCQTDPFLRQFGVGQ